MELLNRADAWNVGKSCRGWPNRLAAVIAAWALIAPLYLLKLIFSRMTAALPEETGAEFALHESSEPLRQWGPDRAYFNMYSLKNQDLFYCGKVRRHFEAMVLRQTLSSPGAQFSQCSQLRIDY